MRKLLLLLMGVALNLSIFASPLQSTWRWRNDNGSEEEATWMAADTGTIRISDTTKVLRLRVRIDNTYNGDADIFDIKNILKYTTQSYTSKGEMGSVQWTPITESAGNAFVFAQSVNVSDGDATSRKLTNIYIGKSADSTAAAGFPFVEGKIFSSTDVNQMYKLNPQSSTEVEFVIRATANIQKGVTYSFTVDGTEVYIEDGATSPKLIFVENENPKFVNGKKQTISAPSGTDFNLADALTVNDPDNGQILKWSVVQDPTIATLIGFPTTSSTGSAAVAPEDLFFNAEFDGEETFIVEVTDGFASDTSEVTVMVGGTAVNSSENNIEITVFPNPVKEFVTIASSVLNQYTEISVIDIAGKVIKTAGVNNQNSVTIDANMLSKGLYFVKLTGSDKNATLKFVK